MIKKFFLNDRIFAIKKTVSFILVLFGILFVLTNRDVYYSIHSELVSSNKNRPDTENTISFSGSKIFDQEFSGWDGALEQVNILFSNQGKDLATGNIIINILDPDGNILQSTEKSLAKITRRTTFVFKDPTVLSKNNNYTFQLAVHDAYNPQGFGVCTYTNKGNLFGQLNEDGVPVDNRLRASFDYSFYSIATLTNMLILLLITLLFAVIPFGYIDAVIEKKTGIKSDTNILISRIFFFMSPVLCVFLGDRFNNYHLSEMIHRIFTWQFLFNLSIYILMLLVFYTILNRTQYACILVLFTAFVIHIANYYVWIFRGCPILATDLQSAATAFNVANNFSYDLDLPGVWGTVYIISFTAMILSLRGYKGLRPKQRLFAVASCAVYICLFNGIFTHSDFVQKHIVHSVWNPQRTYAKNGNALSFLMSWSSIRVEKPRGYSAEKIMDITKKYTSDKVSEADTAENHSPNIIVIMNESLADLSYNAPIDLSEDYLPFIHSLSENTVKGKLYVSIEGGNTANSEFEFLTGNTLNFLPYRCVPYNEYIKDVTPSMAYAMKAQSYAGNNAYHPFKSSGWSRTTVYPALGFSNCYFEDYYKESNNNAHIRNYISDEADFRQIIADYEASKKETSAPFYLFNVTIQNHGSYSGKKGLVESQITIKDPALQDPKTEQYLNLAKLSDDAFKMLLEYFEGVKDPTIIVMFGDHQPPLTNNFYNKQFGKDVNTLTLEEKANWYSTPYVIWANYDIEEKELDMSTNYLSSYVMNIAGNKLTGYNKFLLELQEELPVISAICYKDKNGNIYENDEESEYSELLTTYQMLQYNQMFDKENRADDFFFLQ